MKTATYLMFNDNAKEAIEAYQNIFGADVICQYTHNETSTDNPERIGKIFHAEMRIGDLNLYLSDEGEDPDFHSIKFVVEYKDEALAKTAFSALTANGQVFSDFKKMPFGPTIAHGQDRFGIRWDIVIC